MLGPQVEVNLGGWHILQWGESFEPMFSPPCALMEFRDDEFSAYAGVIFNPCKFWDSGDTCIYMYLYASISHKIPFTMPNFHLAVKDVYQ